MKIRLAKILNHLTGISTPVFGISWNPPQIERDTVQRLVTYLEDKRVLATPVSQASWALGVDVAVGRAVASVLEIRSRLGDTLEKLERDSELFKTLSIMREACRDFLEQMENPTYEQKVKILDHIHQIRSVFGDQLTKLCVQYGIDIESDLVIILPFGRDTSSMKDSDEEYKEWLESLPTRL